MDKRIFLIATTLAFTAVACGDDDDKDDGGGVIIHADGSVPAIDAGGIDSSINQQPDSSVGDSSTLPVVKGAPGCFAGTPTTSTQFLNACAEGYVEFDNAKRIPGYVKGQLPSL